MRQSSTPVVISRLRDPLESEPARQYAVLVLKERTRELDQVARAFAETIADDSPPARLYILVVGILGKMGPPARPAVPALIGELSRYRSPALFVTLQDGSRVSAAVPETLHNITGLDFGDDQVRWKKWWEAERAARP